MVFSSAWLAAAARVPAELCQGAPGPGQRPRRRLRGDEVLRALLASPARELERLAGCLYFFFCMPLPEPDQYYVPVSGRGGWMPRRPPGAVLYGYRRSLSLSPSPSDGSTSTSWMGSSSGEGSLYYSDDWDGRDVHV